MVEHGGRWPRGLRQRVLLAAIAVTAVQALAVLGLQAFFMQRVRANVVESWFESLDQLGTLQDCARRPGPRDDGRGWYSAWPLDDAGRPVGDEAPLTQVPGGVGAPSRWVLLGDVDGHEAMVWWAAEPTCAGLLVVQHEPYPILADESDTVAWLFSLRLLVAAAAALALVALTAAPLVMRIRRIRDGTESVVDADFDGVVPRTGPGDELDDLGEAFNAAAAAAKERLDALDQRDELLRRGLADLGHDLRTPLATLKLTVGRLDPTASSTADMRAELEYLSGLVSNFESLLRLGSPHDPEAMQDVDLGLLIERLRRRFKALADERGVTMAFAPPDAALVVRGDQVALEQAVGNLVQNAVFWAVGNVAVLAFMRGEEAVVEVRDDGPGLDADEVARLSTRRERGDDAGGRGEGFGLGLSIADAAVRRHGGRLELQTAPDGGTRAALVLPKV